MINRIDPRTLVAEILLLTVNVAAILGFDRLFEDTSYRGTLIVTAVVAHAVLALTRRLDGGVVLAVLTSLVALAIQLPMTLVPESTRFGLPTADTVTIARSELEASWSLFNSVVAPAPVVTGFVLAAAFGVWVIAFLSDWAAFRLQTPGEALLPSVTSIVFIALIGIPDGQVRHVGWYLAAAVAFVLAHRAASRVTTGSWLGGNVHAGYGSLMMGGLAIGVLALGAGVVGGPLLPGAEEEPLIDWRGAGAEGNSNRQADNPFIELRSSLVELSEDIFFTVRTDSPDYWRQTALDQFDGFRWSLSSTSFSGVSGELDLPDIDSLETTTTTQQYQIVTNSLEWLPAANRPSFIDVPSGDRINFEADLATLIYAAADSGDAPPGFEYTVRSEIPSASPEFLASLPDRPTSSDFLELPDDFRTDIREQAEQITAGGSNAFEKSKLLQDFFLNNFTYSLNLLPGTTGDPTADFLETRVGFCQQFANAFAVMARSIGIPARVAVGFTKGVQDPNDPELWVVQGKHAHSWPEVLIGDTWWRFEPTPGRGSANATSYTGVDDQQVGDREEAAREEALPQPAATPAPGEIAVDAPQPATPNDEFSTGEDDVDGSGISLNPEEQEAAAAEAAAEGQAISRTWLWIGGIALAAVIYSVLVPLLKARRRAHRRHAAATTRDRVHVAWRHAGMALHDAGVVASPSETEVEFASRAAREARINDLVKLGQAESAANFSPADPTLEDAAMAEAIEDALREELNRRATTMDRVLDELNPRELLKN